jgi:hypothetical protein
MMGRKRLVQEQPLAGKLIAGVGATLIVLATGAGAPAEEPLFSPNAPGATGSQARPAATVEKPPSRIEQDPALSKWMTLPAVSDPAYWSSFDSSIGGNVRAGTTFNRNDAPSPSAAAAPGDQLKVGRNILEFKQRRMQALQSPDAMIAKTTMSARSTGTAQIGSAEGIREEFQAAVHRPVHPRPLE